MPIHALLFDLDDTLLETHDAHRIAIRLSCERAAAHHPGWTPEQLQQAFVETYQILERRIESGELTFDAQFSFRKTTWEETLRHCGLSAGLADELAHVYLAERRKRYRLFDEVPSVLDQLRDTFRLVLVTNGLGDLQREKVAAVGLDTWFERVVISGEVGHWKPDPRIFRHALELAEVNPDSAVMFGDSLARDIAGAGALGIGTVWVRRYPHLQPVAGIEPQHTLSDFADLPALLRSWDTSGPRKSPGPDSGLC